MRTAPVDPAFKVTRPALPAPSAALEVSTP
jgi:hypothetical protein